MDDENLEQEDSLNTQEEETTEEVTEEEADEVVEEEDVEELRKRAKLTDDYKKRAEKAEKENKNLKKTKEPSSSDISARDAIALAKADLSDEDIDEVVDYAKYKGISVTEALRSPVMQNSIENRKEERTTAQATSTKSARSTSKTAGEDLLKKAERTGEVPTSDSDMQAMIRARKDSQRAQRRR